MILNYLDGTIQTTNTYTILNNLDTNIIPSVNSNINIGDKEKTIKELFVNDILLDNGEITKKTRYNVDISTSNITSNIINTEENYIIYSLNPQDLNEQGDGSSSYTLEFTNNTTGKLLIYDTIGKEHDVDLYSPINIVVGTTQSSVTINDLTYYTVGGTSNIQSDITGSNITYSSSIVIIKYYNWGYNTEPYFNRNYYSLLNRPYIPNKEIDYYDQKYINDYSINRLFKSIYYENFYDAKIPTDTVDGLTENFNNELIINDTDPTNYFQVISLRYSANNSEYLVNTDSIKTGPHFISEDDSVYSTNKYIAFRGKDGLNERYFITGDISNLIKITDSITISYIVGSGSVDIQDVETYGNGGDKPVGGDFRIQILDNTDNIIFDEIIWELENENNENWQLFTINIDINIRQNGIKLKIVHNYNQQYDYNWNQTFGVRYIGLNILDEYKNYISLENIPSAYPNSNNILWKDNYGNLKIDNYQFTQDYNTLENNPFENTSNYIYTNLNKNIGIGITTPQEKLHVDGNTIINSNLSVASNIYFSGNLYQNGQLYTSYTNNDTSNYLLNNLNTSIIPNQDLVYDLGSVENRFKDLYIGDNSIWLGDEHKLSISEGKIKFRKRLVNNVPDVISSHNNYNEDSLKQILGLSTEQNINYEDIKLKHWLRYARTLDGFENISINEIFRDNETDYQEETSSDLWINHNNNIIFGNYSNIGIGTNTPTEKLDIDGNVIISSNLTVNDTSTLNNVKFLTSYGNWNINMNKIYEKNLTEERMYPPTHNLTSESHTISGQTYGNGLYQTWQSSRFNSSLSAAFNTDTYLMTRRNYLSTGEYNHPTYTNYIVDDYLGEWIKIKLPVKINLTKYGLKRTVYNNEAPSLYKIYGSNDDEKWDVLVDKTSGITYSIFDFEEPITTTGEYQYFALVVNKVVGFTDGTYSVPLTLNAWYIYGKEIITILGGELKITNENSKGITIDNSGFVGFNNNSPQNTIDVDGNINIENNEDKTALILNQKVEQPIVDIKKNDQSILFINELGHIGINNNQPTKTLEVGGDAMIISNLFIGSNIYISGDLFKNDELYTSYTDNDTSNYLLNNLNTSIIPNENLVYNLGSADKRFNELFIHNANVDGTLTTSNLNIIGDITKINTTIYESENLSIFNEQADGPSLNIIHNDNLHNIFYTSNLFNNKKFIVDYNCHVGINTVPEAELHVNGNIKFSGSINNVTSQSLDYIQNLDENIITKITQTSNFLDNKSSNFVISIYNELNDKIDNISIIDNTIVFDGSQVITGFVNANLIPIDNSTIYNDNGVLKVNPNNNNTELNTFIGKYEKTEEYIENINSISNTVTTIDNRFFYENTTLTSNITVSNNHPNFFTSQTIYPRNIYNRTINYTSTTNEWTDIEYTIITNSSDGIFDNNYDTYGSHKVFSHNLTEFYKSSQVFDESGNYTGSNNFKGTIGLSISIDLGRSIYLRTLKFLPNSSTYNSGMPNNFKIYASNDSNCWGDNSHSSWIVIYNNVTLLEYNPYEFTLFGNFNNLLTKYRFFTLVVNNINGNNTYLELNELSIIGVDDIINQPISIDNETNTYAIKLEYNEVTIDQEYNILPPYLNIDFNYLYAHYTFENNFNDSKNSYNLINNNNCVINYDNRLYDNCALYLDGTANIEFPDNINLYNIWNNDNGLTISFWFNMLETTQSYGTILEFAYQSIKYNNESNYRLSIMKNNNDNNSIQIYWKDLNIDKGVTIQLVNSYNNWNHLSFCIDKYGLWYVYLNGKLQTIDISYFEPPDITYNVKVIGRSSYSTSQNFNGYIDDLRFYSKVLDQKEIKILYESIYQTIYTSIFNDIIFADILIVAGGGSGGGSTGGGGGAGGILYTKKNYIPNNSYIFRIGKGGDSVLSNASHDNQDSGNDGINTIAMDTVVFGGGGGGGSKDGVGNPGGSGGGGAFETAFGGSIMTPIYGTVIINGEYYGNVGISTKNSIVSGDGGSGIFNYNINGVTEYYGGAGKGRDSLLNITTTFDNSSTLGGGGGGGGWTSNTYSGKGGNGIVIIKYYLDKNETQEYSIETSDDYKVLSGDKVLLNSSLVRRVYNTGDNYFTVYNLEETDIERNIGTITTFVKLNNILKFNIINNINDQIVYYSNSENYTKIVIPRNDIYKININAVFNLEFSSEFCKFYIKLDRLGYKPRYLRTFYLPPISEYSSNDSFTLDVTADLELLVNDIITFESNYKLSVYKDSFLTITGTNKTIIDGTLIQNIYNTSANEAFVFQSPLNKLGNIVSLDQSQLNFNINFSQPLIYNNNNVSIQTNYYANYSHTHSASDIVSGIFDKSLLPIATDTDIGCIKVDNTSILIDSFGMISATPHYTDTDFDLRYDIRRSEGLQISGPANNINTLVSANIGVYDSIYSYIDLRTSSNNGGWIDFGSTAGEDFKVRIRGHNEPRQIEFYTSDNANMTLNESGDLLVSGNITAYYSDERLKKITSNIENVLNTLQNIDVFKYKTNDLAHSLGIINNNDEIGLSAQQVNKYYPELVSIAPFDRKYDENIKDIISKSGQKYLTLNYERLVPILLQGIKELNNKNIKLENELSEIKNDIKNIKKHILQP